MLVLGVARLGAWSAVVATMFVVLPLGEVVRAPFGRCALWVAQDLAIFLCQAVTFVFLVEAREYPFGTGTGFSITVLQPLSTLLLFVGYVGFLPVTAVELRFRSHSPPYGGYGGCCLCFCGCCLCFCVCSCCLCFWVC